MPPIYSDHDITIDSVCLQTYPCQHRVCYKDMCRVMSATEIVKLLKQLGKPIPPHFMYINK